MPEISLEYVCGCRDVLGQVAQLAEEAVHTTALPCSSDGCQTCAEKGICATNRALGPIHPPTNFEDVRPIRKPYQRMKLGTPA